MWGSSWPMRRKAFARHNSPRKTLSMEYQVDVETCVFTHLKGIAVAETMSCDKSGCRAEMDASPKRIVYCCLGDGCNGEKTLIQRDLVLLKKSLEHRPKTNALLLYELACLMDYFKLDEAGTSTAIRDFFF